MNARDKLDQLLADHRDELTLWEAEAFVDMAAWLSGEPGLRGGEPRISPSSKRNLSSKQIHAIEQAYDRIVPQYENLASSGKLVLGRPVETPEMLRPENLPKKPPGRR